jgi:hypothetical protein
MRENVPGLTNWSAIASRMANNARFEFLMGKVNTSGGSRLAIPVIKASATANNILC